MFLSVKVECAQCHDHPFAKWTRTQFWEYAAFFSGLDLVEPGVVPILAWHPDDGEPVDPHAASHYAGMARKP